VYPVVHVKQQEAVVEYLRGSQLHLCGDGHCDSPGYSNKYCMYTLMDFAIDLILYYSLVQCTDTVSSVTMEKEGLQWFLDKINDTGCRYLYYSYRQTH